jgi:hypothetical protein
MEVRIDFNSVHVQIHVQSRTCFWSPTNDYYLLFPLDHA